MSWGLFIQIVVLMLIGGFIVFFNAFMIQDAKDRSFAKRCVAIGEALKNYDAAVSARKTDERAKMFGEFIEKMMLKKDENNDKRGS